jgi:hypothetical protein
MMNVNHTFQNKDKTLSDKDKESDLQKTQFADLLLFLIDSIPA